MNWHRIILVFLMTLLMQYSNHMVSCVITDVRLVGGPSSNKGTVEVKQDGGNWETTCGMNLDTNDVIVICRQLGFTGASLAVKTTPYGQNSNPRTGLNCNGSEGNLSACPTLEPTSGCSPAGSASCHGDGYIGCFVDMTGDRVLSGDSLVTISMMTIPYCIQFCQGSTTANYVYAGVESGNECYCGKASDNYTRHREGVDADCSFPCHGDPTESCGGSGYIAVFTTAMTTTVNTPTKPTTVLATSPLSTTSIATSINQAPTTSNGDRISSLSPPPQSSTSSFSPSSSPSSSSSSSSPPPPSSSPLPSSSLESQGTSTLHTAGNSTGLFPGIGGGVAAVVIVLIVIVAIVCFTKRRSQQRKKGIASSEETTLPPVSRRPAYDEINDFGIPNGAMVEASSARSFQPWSQAQSNANSSRGNKNVLLVNLNSRKSTNIYEGTMDETPDDELTSYTSRGTLNSNDRLSVLYAMPGKNRNSAEDGYDEINLGIAPYSSFENSKQPTTSSKMADRMNVVYAAPDKNRERNGASEDLDSLYAMPDKNGNRNNHPDETSEDVGSLYAMPDKSRGKPDGYDGDQDLYAIANDSFSGDQYDEMEMVDNELYSM